MKIPKKSLSQNFINDKNICKKIIHEIEIKNRDILEIGPGYGFLTDFIIAEKPKSLLLVEKDNDLYEYLKNKYKKYNNIKILNNDILKINLKKTKDLNVISNLPYNISSKVILHLLKYSKNIHEMVFMIQKEVALKIDYNEEKLNKYKFFLKIACKYNRCFNVPRNVFYPKPKVESSVVKLKLIKNNIDWEKANKFSSTIFKNKRKKISNKIRSNELSNSLLNQRIDQININDLLRIYNIF